jgi:hypothetical protein
MLLSLFLEAAGGDWDQSWKSIRDTFGSGIWNRALEIVEETYGPLDAMKTEDNSDVWEVWKSSVWCPRGLSGFRPSPALPPSFVS